MHPSIRAVALAALACLSACSGGGGSVPQKVLGDFGIVDRPDEYQSQAEQVRQNLSQVGPAELRRLNQQSRHGVIKYQEDGLRGMYYKEVKIYEDFYPLDARATNNTNKRERGFDGFVEYTYQIYQSERRPNRTEAAAETATIPTGETGKELYRYRFNSGGVWNGSPGTIARRN
jgi:hypothetical protein